MSRQRPSSPTDSTATSPATATMTVTITPDSSQSGRSNPSAAAVPVATLKLRPVKKKTESGRHIHWSEDTVDNEDLNRKKSNICCIFHPNEDHDCDSHCTNDQEIPDGKNVYEFQPQYNKKIMNKKERI